MHDFYRTHLHLLALLAPDTADCRYEWGGPALSDLSYWFSLAWVGGVYRWAGE